MQPVGSKRVRTLRNHPTFTDEQMASWVHPATSATNYRAATPAATESEEVSWSAVAIRGFNPPPEIPTKIALAAVLVRHGLPRRAIMNFDRVGPTIEVATETAMIPVLKTAAFAAGLQVSTVLNPRLPIGRESVEEAEARFVARLNARIAALEKLPPMPHFLNLISFFTGYRDGNSNEVTFRAAHRRPSQLDTAFESGPTPAQDLSSVMDERI